MTAGLFIISTLALLASASADACSSSSVGTISDNGIVAYDSFVPAGGRSIAVQNPCAGMLQDEVGVEAVACSNNGGITVSVDDFEGIYVSSSNGVQLTVTAFCAESRNRRSPPFVSKEI